MKRREFLRGAGIAAMVPLASPLFSKRAAGQPPPEVLGDYVHTNMRCPKCTAHLECYTAGTPDARMLAQMQSMMDEHLGNNCAI